MTTDKQSWELEIEQKIREAENEKLLQKIEREVGAKESESKESERDWSGGA